MRASSRSARSVHSSLLLHRRRRLLLVFEYGVTGSRRSRAYNAGLDGIAAREQLTHTHTLFQTPIGYVQQESLRAIVNVVRSDPITRARVSSTSDKESQAIGVRAGLDSA